MSATWTAADEKYALSAKGGAAWDKAVAAWAAANEKWELKAKWTAFVALLAVKLWEPLKAQLAKYRALAEEKGVASKAQALWQRTGIPGWVRAQYKSYEDNQVLRLRMREVAAKERRAKGWP